MNIKGRTALHAILTSVVGVIQFWHSLNLCVLDSRALLIELSLSFKLHPVHDTLHNSTAISL